MRRRRLEDINDRSVTSAVVAWLLDAGFQGLGGAETTSKPDDFLPFKIVDPNDLSERLKRSLGTETIEIFKELARTNQIPSYIVRDFYSIDEFYELVKNER